MIFLRPLVVRDANIETDLASYRRYLPDREFFRDTEGPVPEFQENLQQLEKTKWRSTPEGLVAEPLPKKEDTK